MKTSVKIMVAAFGLISSSAFATAPVNIYDCSGAKFDPRGNEIGVGQTRIVLLDNGAIRVVSKSDGGVIQLLHEGTDSSGSAQIYRTTSVSEGLGFSIQNSNINVKLDSQVYIYIFGIKNGAAGAIRTLDCQVSGSSKF